MDITPIYDLRARLRAAMIAGTNLLTEDFRLKRAVEAVAPLEQASPVFARIGQLSRALLDQAQTDREGALLDTITLVDAVLCTQGVVDAHAGSGKDAENEIQKLPGNAWGSAVTNAPYSVVSTLLEALTSSGSGHFSFVTETHETRPELFSDYRVKAALVQALGAGYSELADLVEGWLKEEDTSLLPLLQKGFDPGGKKEMVRRIRVMETIAPRESNPFFVEQLQDAKKEVRQALIFSLRHCPENEELLWELSKTEKGNSKQAVYQALAHMDSEKTEQFFIELYQKKPKEAMQNLRYAQSPWAARLVAAKLQEQLQPFIDQKDYTLTEEQAAVLQATVQAAAGKTGPEIMSALRKTIQLGSRLDHPFEDKKKSWTFFLPFFLRFGGSYRSNHTGSFQEMLVLTIYRTLLRTADLELGQFAVDIYQEKQREKEIYFPLASVGHLLVDRDCSQWLSKELLGFLHPAGLRASLGWAWSNITWSESRQAFIFQDIDTSFELLDGYEIRYVHALPQDMTGGIADVLMKCRDEKLDKLLERYISRDNQAYRAKLEEYYYKRALEVNDNRSYLRVLKSLGCNHCEGLAVQYFKHVNNNITTIWSIKGFETSFLPGDNRARYQEMQKVYDLVKSGRLKLYNAAGAMDELTSYIEELKSLAASEQAALQTD